MISSTQLRDTTKQQKSIQGASPMGVHPFIVAHVFGVQISYSKHFIPHTPVPMHKRFANMPPKNEINGQPTGPLENVWYSRNACISAVGVVFRYKWQPFCYYTCENTYTELVPILLQVATCSCYF